MATSTQDSPNQRDILDALMDLRSRVDDFYKTTEDTPTYASVLGVVTQTIELLGIPLTDDGPPVFSLFSFEAFSNLIFKARSFITDVDEFDRTCVEIAQLMSDVIRASIDAIVVHGDAKARERVGMLTDNLAYLNVVRSSIAVDEVEAAAEAASEAAVEAGHSRETAESAAGNAIEAGGWAADSALGKAYQDDAESEARSAFAYQCLALLILVIAVAVGAIYDGRNDYYTTRQLIARMTVLIPLGALITYLISLGHAHRTKADEARRIALQLRTITAYVMRLDPESRTELVRTLGTSIYSGSIEPDASGSSGRRSKKSAATTQGMLAEVGAETVRQVVKGAK